MRTNVLTLLNEIDDNMIKNAEITSTTHCADIKEGFKNTAEEPGNKRKRALRKILTAAACFVLVFGLFSIITVVYNGDHTAGNTGFVINNGVLKQYVGDELNVIIPENVVTISGAAFVNSKTVRTIELGSNVAEIEPMSFSPLSSLQKITVNSKNKDFEVIDDILIKKDGTVVFASVGASNEKNADKILVRVLEAMNSHDISPESLERIEIGKAVLHCDKTVTEDNVFPYVKMVEAFGHTVSFEKEYLMLEGNLKFQAFGAGGYFIVASVDNSGIGKTYVITEDEVVSVLTPANDSDEEYNRSVITFFEDDGRLCYERVPRKYYNIQAAGGVFEKCVSTDEIYKETGYAEIKNGKVLYHPQLSITVSEGFDLDSEYELWRKTVGGDIPSMDEYLENNKKLYAKAE